MKKAPPGTVGGRAENLTSPSLKCLQPIPLLRALKTKKGFLEGMLYLGFKERQKIHTSTGGGVAIPSAASFDQIAFLSYKVKGRHF